MAQHNPNPNRSLEQETELTRAYPGLLELLRKDMRAMVREEVGDVAAKTEEEVRGALHDLARRKRRAPGGDRISVLSGGRLGIAAAIASVVVLTLFLAGPVKHGTTSVWNWLFPPVGSQQAATTTTLGQEEQEASGGDAESPPTYEFAVQRYDKLFQAADPVFHPLADTIQELLAGEIRRAAQDPRRVNALEQFQSLDSALVQWRAQKAANDTTILELVHTAFVQAVLRKTTTPQITIDGDSDREDCTGTTCPAMREMWKAEDKGMGGLPAYVEPWTAEDLKLVEKVLLYNRVVARKS